MECLNITIDKLPYYINAAFDRDYELIEIYDKSVPVKSIDDVCSSVFFKIESICEELTLMGVYANSMKAGFFVYKPGYLVSFGLKVSLRTKDNLKKFWELIKSHVGESFQCALFSYNERAIQWLKKCGMNIVFENITILQLCQQ